MKKPYEIIKELREDADLKQKEIASSIGTSQQTYSKYENGKYEIPAHLLCALADYYGVTTDYILGRTKSTKDIEALTYDVIPGYTTGQLWEDILSLDEAGRMAVVEFVEFRKSK